MNDLKFTDPNFIENFAEECRTSPIGSTEMMLYYLGKALLDAERVDPPNIIERIIDRGRQNDNV